MLDALSCKCTIHATQHIVVEEFNEDAELSTKISLLCDLSIDLDLIYFFKLKYHRLL
jgi:hypothetical protein